MYKIENLEQIWSVDLKRNIILLKEEICEFIFQNWNDPDLSKKVNGLLYYHVLGVGRPISICDGQCKKGGYVEVWGYDSLGEDDYKITLVVDYKVTSGYKPFQDLERSLHLSFVIDKNELRDMKINQILS